MTDYLGTDGHGFFKGTAGLRDVNGLISIKAILKYRHGSLAQPLGVWAFRPRPAYKANQAVNLRKQAVITKYRGASMRSQSRAFEKAVSIRA